MNESSKVTSSDQGEVNDCEKSKDQCKISAYITEVSNFRYILHVETRGNEGWPVKAAVK